MSANLEKVLAFQENVDLCHKSQRRYIWRSISRADV